MKTIKEMLEICPLCLGDSEVACPRNVDAKCLECENSFCGLHISEHLSKEYFISTTWRGFLKEISGESKKEEKEQ